MATSCTDFPRVASVDNISFTDYDLDFGDIGGTIAWDKPEDESKAGELKGVVWCTGVVAQEQELEF